MKELIFLVAQPAYGFTLRRIVSRPIWKIDPPRFEKTSDALIPGLPIHTVPVVRVDVKRFKDPVLLITPPFQKTIEQSLPCGRMHLRCLGDNAVHVKDHSVVGEYGHRGLLLISHRISPCHEVIKASPLSSFFSVTKKILDGKCLKSCLYRKIVPFVLSKGHDICL